MSHQNANVNAADKEGNTALLLASDHNYVRLVQLLLTHGAKQLPNQHGATPLLVASSHGSLKIVKLLLQTEGRKYIDVAGSHRTQYTNLTPLLAAAALAHEEIVLCMLHE